MTRGEDGGFPIWRCSVCSSSFVRLKDVSESQGCSFRKILQVAALRASLHAPVWRLDLQRRHRFVRRKSMVLRLYLVSLVGGYQMEVPSLIFAVMFWK